MVLSNLLRISKDFILVRINSSWEMLKLFFSKSKVFVQSINLSMSSSKMTSQELVLEEVYCLEELEE